MRRKIFGISALIVFVLAFAFSFMTAAEEATAADSLCKAPFCWAYCLCQMEFQQGIYRNGECLLNVCEVCNGPGVNCL